MMMKMLPRSDRPDIIEVVSRYITLRKSGREFFGLAPCHNDRNPSLRVNPDKQVWYCDPCGSGGDVIRFIEVVEKVDFKEAIKILGMTSDRLPLVKQREDKLRLEAKRVAVWADRITARCNAMLREVGQQIHFAVKLKDKELLDSFGCEWRILETFAEDLQNKDHVLDLYRQRESVENLLSDAIEEPATFPALTPEYCARVSEGVAILAPYFEEIYSKQRRAA